VKRLPRSVRISVILRSLLVQAAWNYRTMLGTGMAFALLPVLRYLHTDAEALDAALERHSVHFNAHPYLTPVALGALARMEVDGVQPEQIARFRDAVRGPLGALGDRLVWAGWLPMSALVGVALVHMVAPVVGVVVFLVLFNILHLTLRIRGFHLGFEAGPELGRRIRELDLSHRARQVEGTIALLLGVVVALWMPGMGGAAEGIWWVGGSALALLVGYAAGPRAWRPTAWIMIASVVTVGLWARFI